MQEVKTKGFPTSIRTTVAASLDSSGSGGEFRTQLRERGIDLVLRYGNGDRLFGTTLIDHNSRTVLNGSALRKDFAANALAERFLDIATASQENKRPVKASVINIQEAPMREILQPMGQAASGNHHPTPKRLIPKKKKQGRSI